MSEDISNTLNLLFKNFEDEKNDDIVDKRKNNIYRLEGKHDDACIGFVKYLHGNLTTAMKSNLLQSFKTELHRKCGDYNGLFESPSITIDAMNSTMDQASYIMAKLFENFYEHVKLDDYKDYDTTNRYMVGELLCTFINIFINDGHEFICEVRYSIIEDRIEFQLGFVGSYGQFSRSIGLQSIDDSKEKQHHNIISIRRDTEKHFGSGLSVAMNINQDVSTRWFKIVNMAANIASSFYVSNIRLNNRLSKTTFINKDF